MSWNADQYKSGNRIQELLAIDAIEMVLGNEISGKVVLDMGCGIGNITKQLATKFKAERVHGIDISPSMINYCKCNNLAENITYELTNLKNLDVVNSYDIITSFFCLHWLTPEDKLKTFKAVKRALKPGGKFLFMGGIYGEHQTTHHLIDAIKKIVEKHPQLKEYSIGELTGYHRFPENVAREVFSECGLSVLKMAHLDVPLLFASEDELGKFIRPLITPMPILKQIPEENVDLIISEVYQGLKNNTYTFYTTITVVQNDDH